VRYTIGTESQWTLRTILGLLLLGWCFNRGAACSERTKNAEAIINCAKYGEDGFWAEKCREMGGL
jgi:hypothetical protein